MADTGYSWSAWAAMQIGAGDWTSDAVANDATDTGDALSLTGKAGCEVGIDLYEDNTGAVSSDGVNIYILGTADGTNYEEIAHEPSSKFNVTAVQNDHVYFRFSVDPRVFGTVKIAVENKADQELAVTVKYRTATVPVASA